MVESTCKTHEQLVAEGFIYRGQRNCKFPNCRGVILVYQNTATKKWYSMDYLTRDPHWMHCLENKRKADVRAAHPKPKQEELFF
ncbi:MAG TPA: hypothetical protein VGD54_07545 [Steroidobacteraceae bacterium]